MSPEHLEAAASRGIVPPPDYDAAGADLITLAARVDSLLKENKQLLSDRVLLECRLAACAVVAGIDTRDEAASARAMSNELRSYALGLVEQKVDECIALREEVAKLRAAPVAAPDSPAAPPCDITIGLLRATKGLLEGLEGEELFPGHNAAFLKIVAIPQAKDAVAKAKGGGYE